MFHSRSQTEFPCVRPPFPLLQWAWLPSTAPAAAPAKDIKFQSVNAERVLALLASQRGFLNFCRIMTHDVSGASSLPAIFLFVLPGLLCTGIDHEGMIPRAAKMSKQKRRGRLRRERPKRRKMNTTSLS